ncbi:cuticle protein 64 [Fopius arisanus]|uniref:Cuticle protein 64 n=1 Tax=Fopius arisanus TaxID=64838 RepID=A0A0C9R5F6_9HYME|nr:PREDICTED: cuticle protein 64-like [Fopius arisanus]
MYKFVTIFALIAVACAAPKPAPGYVAAPALVHSASVVAAPALVHSAQVVAAPVVHSVHSVPVATSHSSTYKVDHKSYVAAPAVALHAAPVAVHTPVVAAPLAYSAHAVPLSYSAHSSHLSLVH